MKKEENISFKKRFWSNEERKIVNKIFRKYGYINISLLKEVLPYRSIDSIASFLKRNNIPYVFKERPKNEINYSALKKIFKIYDLDK